MKTLLISDLHFGHHQNDTDYCDRMVESYADMFERAIAMGVTHVVIAGDLGHHPDAVSLYVLPKIAELFRRFVGRLVVILIPGNHDCYFRDKLEPNLCQVYPYLSPNVSYVGEVSVLDLSPTTRMVLVPWVLNWEDTVARIKAVAKPGMVIVGHFEFKGFAFNRYFNSKHGAEVSALDLPEVAAIYSGHFHTASMRMLGQIPVRYIGSPAQFTKIDAGEEKGGLVIDSDDAANPTFIPTRNFPIHLRVEYPEMPSAEQVKGNIIDIRVTVSQMQDKAFDKFKQAIVAMAPYDTDVTPRADDTPARAVDEEEQIAQGAGGDVIDIIREHVEQNAPVKASTDEVLAELHALYDTATDLGDR